MRQKVLKDSFWEFGFVLGLSNRALNRYFWASLSGLVVLRVELSGPRNPKRASEISVVTLTFLVVGGDSSFIISL